MSAHERLVAWQRSHELVLAVYRISAAWPAAERYGLTAQVRRAAASIPANIAEGAARQGPREFRRFLDIALGSLGELNYLLHLAADLAILTPTDAEVLTRLRTATGGTLWPLYRSMLQASTPTRPSRPSRPSRPPHPPY